MEHEIITIFCLLDDLLKSMNIKDDIRSKITNAEISTLAYIAVRYFRGNYLNAHKFYMGMKLSYQIDYSRFIRRVNKLHYAIDYLFGILGNIFCKTTSMAIYSVDSFPVEVVSLNAQVVVIFTIIQR
jgi:hypothetical protein